MEAREESLHQIADALPEQFQFYHLGEVVLQATEISIADSCAIAFTLAGDFKATVMVLFEKGLDSSLYSELGNILVSKIANQLSIKFGVDLLISSPITLSELQMKQLLDTKSSKIRRNYAHFYQSKMIPLETIIIDLSVEEIGHA